MKKLVAYRIEESLIAEGKEIAKKTNRSMNQLIVDILIEKIKKENKEKE